MIGRLLIAISLLLFAGPLAAAPRLEFLSAGKPTLGNPHDLALSPDGAHLFVSDVENDRIAILDAETLDEVGELGVGLLDGVHDVFFDQSGALHVADTHNSRVLIYRMDGLEGTVVNTLSDRVRGPEGVLAHPNGRIYVAGAWSNNVVAYENGEVLAELNGLSSPHDLALSPDGDIWLADAGADRMALLSPDLEIVRILQGAPFDFNGVRYQDVLPDGGLIVADKNNHQVKLISAEGELIQTVGSGRPLMGPDEFTTPEGVAIRGDTVWISDSGNDRVVKYRLVR